MTERTEELIRRAIIESDEKALDQLMLIGQKYEADKCFEDASKIFRAAISAYRQRSEAAERRATLTRDIYQAWMEVHLSELRDWRSLAHKIDDERIRRVVVEQLCREDRFVPVFVYLEEVLSALGMQFYSPGGSIQRRVWVLLTELFGLREPSKYVEYPAVRVGLEHSPATMNRL